MAGLDLEQNPFTLLGVTPRSTRDDIADAHEDRAADGAIGEARLLRAQQALMASKPRLAAELSWLTGLAPARARELLAHKSISLATIASLPPLAASNLLASRLGLAPAEELPDLLLALIAAHRELTPSRLVDIVNAERQIAGFPKVDSDFVAPGYDELREAQIASALAVLSSHDNPGAILERTIAPFLLRKDYALDFLEQLIEAFDRSREADYQRIIAGIAAAKDALTDDPRADAPLESIDRLLVDWDRLNQPRQLLFQAKGLDEPRSQELCKRVRDIAIELANEHQSFHGARRISQALKRTFPELPTALPQLEKDLEILAGLIEEQEKSEAAQPYLEAVRPYMDKADQLATSLGRGEFTVDSKGLAGDLFRDLRKMITEAKDEDARLLAWQAAPMPAMTIGAEKDDPHRALLLVEALLSFNPAPPAAAREDLETIRRALRHNAAFLDLTDAINGKDPARINKMARAFLPYEEDPERRQQLQQIIANTDSAVTSSNGKRIFWWAVAAGIAGIIIWSNVSDRSPSRQPSSQPNWAQAPAVAPRTTTTLKQTPPARSSSSSVSDIMAAALRETKPAPHDADAILSVDQIRWCLYRETRIDGMQGTITTEAQRQYYNRQVDDWNAVCSSYRYYEDKMAQVLNQRAERRELLRIEGRNELAAVTHSAGAPPGALLLDPAGNSKDAKRIQFRLIELGFNAGMPDGIWGQNSRNALRAFKIANGLTDSQTWDWPTQIALFKRN